MKRMSTTRAVVAAMASGILLCAIAQEADAAAIKSPVGGASGAVVKAPPTTTDHRYGCGYRNYRCSGSWEPRSRGR
jgi:hypothetical protein